MSRSIIPKKDVIDIINKMDKKFLVIVINDSGALSIHDTNAPQVRRSAILRYDNE